MTMVHSSRRASQVRGRRFPYADPTVTFMVARYNHNLSLVVVDSAQSPAEKLGLVDHAASGKDKVFAIWPGSDRSDVFVLDDLDAARKALKPEGPLVRHVRSRVEAGTISPEDLAAIRDLCSTPPPVVSPIGAGDRVRIKDGTFPYEGTAGTVLEVAERTDPDEEEFYVDVDRCTETLWFSATEVERL